MSWQDLCRAMLVAVCAGVMSGPVAWPAAARVLIPEEAALRAAFGDSARVEPCVVTLTPAELKRANELAGEGGGEDAMRDPVIRFVIARCCSTVTLGAAYFDTRRIRTLDGTIMIAVTPDARIGRVEILRFDEPSDYAPPRRWLDRLAGRRLDRDLSLKGTIHGITGATLTSRAVTRAARRALALDAVLREREAVAP